MTEFICFQCLTDPNAHAGSDDLPTAKAFTLLAGTALCKKHAREIADQQRRSAAPQAPVIDIFVGAHI